MDTQSRGSSLKERIIPFVEDQGYKVFEMRLFYSGGRLSLRILVDFPQGGIRLEECAAVNRKVSAYLEEHALIDENFILEVSSPGLARDLVTLDDFLRIKNNQIMVWLKSDIQGRSYYETTIVDVDKEKRHLACACGGETINIPVDMIQKARQKIS